MFLYSLLGLFSDNLDVRERREAFLVLVVSPFFGNITLLYLTHEIQSHQKTWSQGPTKMKPMFVKNRPTNKKQNKKEISDFKIAIWFFSHL